MTEPEREPRRYQRNEKEEEKEEEKRNEKEWDEKWRHDPVSTGSWAAILIWAGVVLLGQTNDWGPDKFPWWSTWSLIMSGAGAILLLGALVRLLVPAQRRQILGNVILGTIFLGVGLNDLIKWSWETTGAIILIVIGVLIFLGGMFRRRR